MTGAQAAKLAAGYVGRTASTFRAEYQRMTGQSTSGDWCCLFASCVVVGWAGAKLEGLPSTWCPSARVAATSAGREVPLSEARAGDVAYFEWTGNENADHVGIVESYAGGVLTTIDGNVSNRVGRRSRTARNWRKVWVVRPRYAEEKGEDLYIPKTISKGSTGNEVVMLQAILNMRAGAGIRLDAEFGDYTAKKVGEWQKAHGLSPDMVCGPKTWPTLLGN